jgi:hypothetical protein
MNSFNLTDRKRPDILNINDWRNCKVKFLVEREYCLAYAGLQTPLFLTLKIFGRKEY